MTGQSVVVSVSMLVVSRSVSNSACDVRRPDAGFRLRYAQRRPRYGEAGRDLGTDLLQKEMSYRAARTRERPTMTLLQTSDEDRKFQPASKKPTSQERRVWVTFFQVWGRKPAKLLSGARRRDEFKPHRTKNFLSKRGLSARGSKHGHVYAHVFVPSYFTD